VGGGVYSGGRDSTVLVSIYAKPPEITLAAARLASLPNVYFFKKFGRLS
jgi:hypothetical protein